MKKSSVLLAAFILILSCKNNNSDKANSTDVVVENSSAPEVKEVVKPIEEVVIQNQTWALKNLDVTHFQNGDEIPIYTNFDDFSMAGNNEEPALCYYDFDSDKGRIYGAFYNWYALNDSREIAPSGWRVPTKNDWELLVTNLGGEVEAVEKIKSKKMWLDGQKDPKITNSSGFTAMPSGEMSLNRFSGLGYKFIFWSSTTYTLEGKENEAYTFQLSMLGNMYSNSEKLSIYEWRKKDAYSIRLIKE